MNYADLHIHSIYSDGTQTPKEIIKEAKEKGYRCISITDHEAIDGIDEAIAAGKKAGIEVIPGCEIFASEGEILAYFLDYKDKLFLDFLEDVSKRKEEFYKKRIENIANAGYNITYKEVKERVGKGRLNSLHIAITLLEKGLIPNIDYFFKEMGKDRKILRTTQTSFPIVAVIKEVKKAKGAAVLAHPWFSKIYKNGFKDFKDLVDAGLNGLEFECYITPADIAYAQEKLSELAEKYDLILTRGSDYHGEKMEAKFGKVSCSKEIVDALKQRHKKLFG